MEKIKLSIFAYGPAFLFVGLLTQATSVFALNSYQVNASASTTITEHTVSKVVTNNCSKAVFVPTKTAPEWTSFYTNPPACVTVADPPCPGPPSIGAACTDGALYAGTYNGYTYQTTPGNCTNSATPTCNGATDTLTKVWASTLATTSINSWSDGLANSNAIIALYPADDSAAKYCRSMTYAGHSDWFLPAGAEMILLQSNGSSFSGYDTSGVHYWASDETSSTNARSNLSSRGKNVTTVRVRCVRKY